MCITDNWTSCMLVHPVYLFWQKNKSGATSRKVK